MKEWKIHMQLYPNKKTYDHDVKRMVDDHYPLCGGGSYFNLDQNFVTNDSERVTCQRCLKKIKSNLEGR